jgi:hypothetical protein
MHMLYLVQLDCMVALLLTSCTVFLPRLALPVYLQRDRSCGYGSVRRSTHMDMDMDMDMGPSAMWVGGRTIGYLVGHSGDKEASPRESRDRVSPRARPRRNY